MCAYRFRDARPDDLARLVEMLADDELGQTRELPGTPINQGYRAAFQAIREDPNNELVVCEASGEIVGMLQLTFIPCLTHVGSWRALIEGVRVSSSQRGKGIGGKLLQWAIQRARAKGCLIVQLASDKTRPDAIRFYESRGFKATHEGMKLWLK